jgi:hypothetical protein
MRGYDYFDAITERAFAHRGYTTRESRPIYKIDQRSRSEFFFRSN